MISLVCGFVGVVWWCGGVVCGWGYLMADIVLLLAVWGGFECGSRGWGVLGRVGIVSGCGWVLGRPGGSDRCWGYAMSSE